MKKLIAIQAELAMEIPDHPETFAPFYIVTAEWTGRGPSNGSRKVFEKIHLTKAAAEKAANNLKPEWRKRRIYKLQ